MASSAADAQLSNAQWRFRIVWQRRHPQDRVGPRVRVRRPFAAARSRLSLCSKKMRIHINIARVSSMKFIDETDRIEPILLDSVGTAGAAQTMPCSIGEF